MEILVGLLFKMNKMMPHHLKVLSASQYITIKIRCKIHGRRSQCRGVGVDIWDAVFPSMWVYVDKTHLLIFEYAVTALFPHLLQEL